MKNLMIVIASFLLFSIQANAQKGYSIGDKAMNFKLKNIDGKLVSLQDYNEEKGVILIFSCNHCPYVKAYEDRMVELDKKYKKMGFPLIAINPNDPEIVPEDSYKNMQKRAKEKKFGFPYLIDEKQDVYKDFGATKTPHVYLLNNDKGNFTVEYIGAIDDSPRDANTVVVKYLENAIEALLKGKKPNPNVTKAIGCSIKTKS